MPDLKAGVQEMLMAVKTENTGATHRRGVAEATDTPPLLDLSDAGGQEAHQRGQKRGYVTMSRSSIAEEVHSEPDRGRAGDVLRKWVSRGRN